MGCSKQSVLPGASIGVRGLPKLAASLSIELYLYDKSTHKSTAPMWRIKVARYDPEDEMPQGANRNELLGPGTVIQQPTFLDCNQTLRDGEETIREFRDTVAEAKATSSQKLKKHEEYLSFCEEA